jgi:hypothetical protein
MTPNLSPNVEQRSRPPLPTAARLFVGAVIGAGALVLLAYAPREYPQPWLVLTFLAAMLVVSLFKLRIPLGRGCSTMSMAYVVDFLMIVTAGPDVAMAIAAVGALVQCTVNVRRKQPWYRAAFSVASVALAVKSAGTAWQALGGVAGVAGPVETVLPLAAAAVVYFAVNAALVATAVALASGEPLPAMWQGHFVRTAPGYLVAASVVAVVELLMRPEVYLLLPSAAVPMIICHLAYAAWFRQLAEQQPAQAQPQYT